MINQNIEGALVAVLALGPPNKEYGWGCALAERHIAEYIYVCHTQDEFSIIHHSYDDLWLPKATLENGVARCKKKVRTPKKEPRARSKAMFDGAQWWIIYCTLEQFDVSPYGYVDVCVFVQFRYMMVPVFVYDAWGWMFSGLRSWVIKGICVGSPLLGSRWFKSALHSDLINIEI